MKYTIVKCPKCNKEKKVYARWFFRCCGRAFDIRKCTSDTNNKIFIPNEMYKEETGVKIDENT